MLRTHILSAAMAVAIVAGASAAAFAATGEKEDAHDIATVLGAKTSLAEAIATAEQHVGGRAIEASLDDENGGTQFEVEVAKDKTIHKVMVDSATGKLVKATTDDDDEDDED